MLYDQFGNPLLHFVWTIYIVIHIIIPDRNLNENERELIDN